ncbi:MAG TPA: adenylate/guanylate cyclase domain-containing protein [Chitinophagaceae bacterium]
MSSTRQLAAIMFADIVGYTAMMQDDEALAMNCRQKLKQKLEEEVSRHNGRILEFRGDGAMCIFTSTIQGVNAALALQTAMQTDPIVPLRIGMHTGDVIFEGNTIYGDGVNIASRMESFAIPGSIFISAKVFDDIKNQKDIQSVSLGKYALKNVKEQVEIFAISNPGIKVPDRAGLEGKGEKAPQKCILVLPFLNMSNDPEQEYFNDGLTEELISSLSRLKEMKVISRTTSMKYKGTNKDIKTIGLETGASYIMEGSVRKQGNNLRITAQFLDANRDVHVWAENYRGTLDDIFDIQENVAAKIVEALRLQLTIDEKDVLQKRYTENSEAYQYYLQGRYFWKKRNEEGLKSAIRHFEKALEKDPDYALAWAGLADTYSLMGEFTPISRRVLFPKQMDAVHKALKIDDRLGEAHISLAISLMLNEWDWKNSEKEFKLGIAMSPNYATGHHWYAEWLLYNGKPEQAYREISLAVELDPVSPGIVKDKGIHFYYTRQYDQAVNMAMIAFELDPDFLQAHRLLSLAYTGMGQYEKAIAENQHWGNGTGNKVKTDVALAHIYAAAGRNEEARQIIEQTGLEKILSGNDYRGIAIVYAALGENDKAFEWLEKSCERHEESLCSLNVDPKFDNLHTDPRFKKILKRLNFPG